MDVHIKPISVETMRQRYTEALVDLQCAKDRIAELERERDLAWEDRCDQARAEERERFSELQRAAEEIDAYLCENKLNSVGASSILHNRLRRGLQAIRALGDQ